jgi:WD40 repeat protein
MKAIQGTVWMACLLGLTLNRANCQAPNSAENQPPATNGKCVNTFALPNYPSALAFSPDEKYLAVAIDNGAQDGGWILLGTVHGKGFKKIANQKSGLAFLAFSPSSKRLVTASFNGHVSLFQMPDGKALWTKDYGTKMSRYTAQVSFLPDGTGIVLLGADDPVV